jgi:stage II sporulation protein D
MVLLAGAIAACAPPRRPAVEPATGDTLRVQVAGRGVVRLPLEAYVRGAMLGEMLVATRDRALAQPAFEVQAIVSRTYAAANRGRHARDGFDLCDTSHCQVYSRDEASHPEWRRGAADRDVAATAGFVLTFRSQPIQALYHANCGGHTADAHAIWGGPSLPYLTGVEDPVCLMAPAHWSFAMSLVSLERALNAVPALRTGGRLVDVAREASDATGVTTLVRLVGDRSRTVRGEALRAAVNAAAGPAALRSPKFDIVRAGSMLTFRGRGSGHGVGLCQTGALERLRQGASPSQVLALYYPGTTLERLGGQRPGPAPFPR